jgi:hypothetical protein
MAVVVLPHTIADATAMEAVEVQENDEALRDGINDIAAGQIGVGEINASLLADGAVVAAKIGTGEVTNTKLESGAVTNPKITDGTIQAAKLHSTIQLLVHSEEDKAIEEDATEAYDFAGLDDDFFPQVTLYQLTDVANHWEVLSEYMVTGALTNRISTDCHWMGGTFRVDVTNDRSDPADSPVTIKVVVSGPAA